MLASLNPPSIAPLLRHRNSAIGLWGLAALHFALLWAGLPGWPCPVLQLFGVPCPGCGLTRATGFLIHGDIHASFNFHAFAPVFMLGLCLAGVAAVLPERARTPLINSVEYMDRRTGFTVILLVGLILYWLARLLLFRGDFVRLMRG